MLKTLKQKLRHVPFKQSILRYLNRKLERQELHDLKESILRDRPFQELLKATLDSVELEQQLFGTSAVRLDQRMEIIRYTCEIAKEGPAGLWLEFGVFKGESLDVLAASTSDTVYGFDSFEGLPEEWTVGRYNSASKGAFQVDHPPLVKENVELVTGLFEDTLQAFLAKHPEPVQFVHIDCDLYSSTKFVLDHLNFQVGSILLFDEYYNYPRWREGEYKAFQEFLQKNQFQAECVCYAAGAWNAAFRLVG